MLWCTIVFHLYSGLKGFRLLNMQFWDVYLFFAGASVTRFENGVVCSLVP